MQSTSGNNLLNNKDYSILLKLLLNVFVSIWIKRKVKNISNMGFNKILDIVIEILTLKLLDHYSINDSMQIPK